jgi:hypothetical protein
MNEEQETFRQEEREVVAGESELLHDIGKGIIGGIAGAVAVAILILIQNTIGFLPEVNFIALMGSLIGMGTALGGWIVLFVAGALLGIAFASLDGHVGQVTEAGEIVHGILFALLLWGALMLILMPVFSGEAYVVTFAIAMLVGLLIFGVVMGGVYGAMHPEDASH